MNTKQLGLFSMCLMILAVTNSIQASELTGVDIEEQARQLINRYREGDVDAYYTLNATSSEGLVPVFLEALNDSDTNVRILAINQLRNHRKVETIGPISDLLKHDGYERMRAAAASSLGQFGHREASPCLLDALNDESADVVQAAIRGLGWLKSKEAIEPLKEKLRGDNEEDWEVQRAAADALQDITGKDWEPRYTRISPRVPSARCGHFG